MKQNEDLENFHQKQKQLVEELKKLVTNENLTIDATNIATDIQNNHTGKALGTEHILDWINKRKFDVHHFYTFGDSNSDIDMAYKIHEIYKDKKKLTFIYVGPTLHWNDTNLKFDLYHYPGFNRGTVEFLSQING